MYQPPKLIQDAADQHKLEISLPGGRYQLSLDDRAVIVLLDRLQLDLRDTVPEPFAPFFVAMGDAWFPSERDTDGIIEDLRMDGQLNSTEKEVLIDYVTESLIPEPKKEKVQSVIDDSPIKDEVNPEDLQINELPEIPEWSELSQTETESTAEPITDFEEDVTNKEAVQDDLQAIRGIGPNRAEALTEAGVTSYSDLADSRPVELATINGITEGTASVAIEGAREIIGEAPPASERLEADTGTNKKVFESVINQLAASGVPASEAESTLRVLYGPNITDIDPVTGEQAYYLWESGYRTPHDLVEASNQELTDVYQVGDKTAANIRAGAKELLETLGD